MQSSNTSRVRFTVISHTPMRSRFYHTHFTCKRNGDDFCVVNLIYFFFKFAICFIALMNLGETCHLKRRNLVTVWRTMLLLCCYHCDWMQQHYDVTQFEYVLWRHTMHEWVMNIHYKTWIAQGRFTNMILTPSKQWGVCDNSRNQLAEPHILNSYPFHSCDPESTRHNLHRRNKLGIEPLSASIRLSDGHKPIHVITTP